MNWEGLFWPNLGPIQYIFWARSSWIEVEWNKWNRLNLIEAFWGNGDLAAILRAPYGSSINHQSSSTILNHHQPSSTITNHPKPLTTILNHPQPSTTIKNIKHHQPSGTLVQTTNDASIFKPSCYIAIQVWPTSKMVWTKSQVSQHWTSPKLRSELPRQSLFFKNPESPRRC